MTDREIRPGRICIIINSVREHNNGKVVEVVRQVGDEPIPEMGGDLFPEGGWLVLGEGLCTQSTEPEHFSDEYGPYTVYLAEYLLPIDDFREDTVKHKEEEFSE